ncbi:hypothetical protein [Magnetofaba australis]|uniref:Uncharacterized protein n=1 Tax=Magnetofaba australis IT-1 TaxID=1434232 RepID=A0A1Y2K779_9PROT|nr:hypothetical protein [Magnetofaba australis]OSM04321.1 hypothetical protein MAIT1_04197 [Magnetofaba australis IT-1]
MMNSARRFWIGVLLAMALIPLLGGAGEAGFLALLNLLLFWGLFLVFWSALHHILQRYRPHDDPNAHARHGHAGASPPSRRTQQRPQDDAAKSEEPLFPALFEWDEPDDAATENQIGPYAGWRALDPDQWRIAAHGPIIGRFQNHPIPAWIRASDGRTADYHGVDQNPETGPTLCLESPDHAWWVTEPGLRYRLRTVE